MKEIFAACEAAKGARIVGRVFGYRCVRRKQLPVPQKNNFQQIVSDGIPGWLCMQLAGSL